MEMTVRPRQIRRDYRQTTKRNVRGRNASTLLEALSANERHNHYQRRCPRRRFWQRQRRNDEPRSPWAASGETRSILTLPRICFPNGPDRFRRRVYPYLSESTANEAKSPPRVSHKKNSSTLPEIYSRNRPRHRCRRGDSPPRSGILKSRK